MFIQSMDMINGKEKGGIIKVKSSGLKKIAYPPVRDKVSVGESLDDWSDILRSVVHKLIRVGLCDFHRFPDLNKIEYSYIIM